MSKPRYLRVIEDVVLSVTTAAAAGPIGCFAVMRRMALAADPLSRGALPGIGVALALHVPGPGDPLAAALRAGLRKAYVAQLVRPDPRPHNVTIPRPAYPGLRRVFTHGDGRSNLPVLGS